MVVLRLHLSSSLNEAVEPSNNKPAAIFSKPGHSGMTTDHKQGDFTDKNTTATDYGYDLNGNLITDLNRKIGSTTGIDQTTGTAIKYNHLNLVDRVNPPFSVEC